MSTPQRIRKQRLRLAVVAILCTALGAALTAICVFMTLVKMLVG